MMDFLFEGLENKITDAVKEFHRQKSILEKIEFPFDIKALDDKKRLEVEYLRKFIAFNGEDIKIIRYFESPDFILEYNNQKVGLEVEQICNSISKIDNGFWQGILNKAAAVFQEEHPGINLMANIFFDKRKPIKINQKEKIEIVKMISDLVYREYVHSSNNGEICSRLSIIKDISISAHSTVHFAYNEGAYNPINLNVAILKEYVARKELKVKRYIETSGIDRHWLLLRVSSAGTESYDIRERNFDDIIKSSAFERIYLMDDFGADVRRIY